MVKVFRFPKTGSGRKKFMSSSSSSFSEFSSSSDSFAPSWTESLFEEEYSSVASTLFPPQNDDQDDTIENEISMVVHEPSSSPPCGCENKSLPASMHTWTQAALAVLQSREMKVLLNSSRDVVTSAVVGGREAACVTGEVVVKTALLPVTVPIHVAHATTDLVCGVAGNVLHLAFGDGATGESTSSTSPIEGLIHNVVNFVPFVADQVGGAVVHVLGFHNNDNNIDNKQSNNEENDDTSSSNKPCETSSGESSAEKETFLDRLRLDIHVPPSSPTRAHSPTTTLPETYSKATPSDSSKYLLRVDDINVHLAPNPAASQEEETLQKVFYIDLGRDFGDEQLTLDALPKLKERALAMTSTNDILKYRNVTKNSMIDWKPEGNTARNISQAAQWSDDEWSQKLQQHVLIWSGKYRGPSCYGSDIPMFLARGIVRKSPREFLNMMWNSNRTSEYNAYNLGRTDSLIVFDDITNNADFTRGGAKVVKSITKVPFTGMSLTLTGLMYASPLEDDDDGYIIVSRSMNSGMAGCHISNERVETNYTSEIIIGVNILRRVPGMPHHSDLTSLSQVSSSVPNFLSTKIGIFGVEDFFKNVR